MDKLAAKTLAIDELISLQTQYAKYVDSVKDKAFDDDIRATLRDKGNVIRWIQQGLENGYYDDPK